MFIEVHRKSGPISLVNTDHIIVLFPWQDGTRIWFSDHDYFDVEESYDEISRWLYKFDHKKEEGV